MQVYQIKLLYTKRLRDDLCIIDIFATNKVKKTYEHNIHHSVLYIFVMSYHIYFESLKLYLR